MRVCTNPYTGQLMDLDTVPESAGGAKFCPITHKPLNAEAVRQFSYPGPAQDRATWEAEAMQLVQSLEKQADQDNAKTFGIKAAK